MNWVDLREELETLAYMDSGIKNWKAFYKVLDQVLEKEPKDGIYHESDIREIYQEVYHQYRLEAEDFNE